MGFLDSIFGSSTTPSSKQVDSTVIALTRRHGEPALRYEAADRLLGWGSDEAIEGLLKRYTVTVERETSDDDEKAYIADQITEKIGSRAIPSVEKYLRHQEQVNWPLRLLKRLTTPEDFRDRVLGILAKLDVHFDKHPIRKVEMIHALIEFAAEPAVSDAVAAFLDDTSDTVRIAAAELLASSAREKDFAAMIDGLIASPDRPRVRAGLCRLLVGVKGAAAARREDVSGALADGFILDEEGTMQVEPSGSSSSAPQLKRR